MLLKKDKSKYSIDTDVTKTVFSKMEEMTKKLEILQDNKLQKYRKEDNLYVVIEKNKNTAYLQNLNNNTVFEETNFSDDFFNKLLEGAILQFKDNAYIFNEELTRKNLYQNT